MKTLKCIVTGGAGFIGSHVVDLLIEKGCKVIVLDNMATGRESNLNAKADLQICDIRNGEKLQSHFKNVDWVFHLAALPRIQPSFDEPVEHEMVNVVGTINCVQAVLAGGVKRFVYSSSSSCYGNPKELPTTEMAPIQPLSPYALQKYTAERYVILLGERFGLKSIALRYFNVYGPRSFNEKNPLNAYSSVIGIFQSQKKSGKPLTVTGNGSQERDFIHVKDVAMANLKAAESKRSWDVFNVGFGKTISILNVAKVMGGPYVFIPERSGEAMVTHANINKTKRALGWKPSINLMEGMKHHN
jgi:UDP-glucose 4-epimerase